MRRNIRECDICGKAIEPREGGILGSTILDRHEVKIKSIEASASFAYSFRKVRRLDMCDDCMKKFREFVRESEV